MKIKNILVPVDFSKFSDRAVKYALFLAENYAANITLLHSIVLLHEEAHEEETLKAYEKSIRLLEEDSHRLFQEHHEDAGTKNVTINSVTIRGISAADSILDFINDNGFDLVVMGTHGRTGFKKWIYGSVAERVVRLSPVPVITIHEPLKEFDIKKVLIPIDFSEYSKKAAQAGVEIAKKFGAKLEFLHVVDQAIHPAFYVSGVESVFTIDRELKERTRDNLKTFAGNGNGGTFTVIEGRPAREIVNYAEHINADFIVMATRGLGGLEHLLIGSTTERVVRWASVPVLTVEREM